MGKTDVEFYERALEVAAKAHTEHRQTCEDCAKALERICPDGIKLWEAKQDAAADLDGARGI